MSGIFFNLEKDVGDNMHNENQVTYWRSDKYQFSVLYKGVVTEIKRHDIGYGDLDRLDGTIHAAIGCKQKNKTCLSED